MKKNILLIILFFNYSLYSAEFEKVTKLTDSFAVSMSRIKEDFKSLMSSELRPNKMISQIQRKTRKKEAYRNLANLFEKRLKLSEKIIGELGVSEFLLKKIGTRAQTYNKELKNIAGNMNEELDFLQKELNDQSIEMFKALNVQGFKLLKMDKDKNKMIDALKKQTLNLANINSMRDYLKALKNMVKTSMLADKALLKNVLYTSYSLRLIGEKKRIQNTVANEDLNNYFEKLQKDFVNTKNLIAALKYDLTDELKKQVKTINLKKKNPFYISIEPDRGVNGVYHPGEEVKFKIKVSKNCMFLLFLVDQLSGNEDLIYPLKFSQDEKLAELYGNYIKAGNSKILPDHPRIRYIAKEPYGLETIKLKVFFEKIQVLGFPGSEKLNKNTFTNIPYVSKEKQLEPRWDRIFNELDSNIILTNVQNNRRFNKDYFEIETYYKVLPKQKVK